MKIAAKVAGPEGEVFATGNEAHHAPQGWRVFRDTSWDGRGDDVAAKDGDIEIVRRGSAMSLSTVRVRPGARYIDGAAVAELLHFAHGDMARMNSGLGLSWQGNPEMAVDLVADEGRE